jgi:hypothetical protein
MALDPVTISNLKIELTLLFYMSISPARGSKDVSDYSKSIVTEYADKESQLAQYSKPKLNHTRILDLQ